MIESDKRHAMYQMHRAGMSLRAISHQMNVSRATVAAVIRQQGKMPRIERKDRIHVDPDLLRRLHDECGGWKQRIHERLVEEHRIPISYSTLTRLLRNLGIGNSRNVRCDQVPDEPGLEMQHDTSVYRVLLGGQRVKLMASLLYLRYSKRRYLKFYRVFNRFAMKCFLHEALMFWGHAPKQCVIDNTNLARWRGTGSRAVIMPEMAEFARQYGFIFICHELLHCNRKAGEERGFWTVETNFLPGRRFEDLADLNRQAFQWATVRREHRPTGKSRLIPAKAFEHERNFLGKLSPFLTPPYRTEERGTDQYGYLQFQANYYWVPGTKREAVKLLIYADRIKVFQRGDCVAEYPLPADHVTNQRFSPAGQPRPRSWPKNQKRSSEPEERRLRAMGPEVAAYVDFAVKTPGLQRHRFVRELFALSRRVTRGVFVQTVERALRYRIVEVSTLQRIAWNYVSQGGWSALDGDEVVIDEDFRDRPAYREGCLTDEPDFARYESVVEEELEEQEVEEEIDQEDPRDEAEEDSRDETEKDPRDDESEDHHG
jgi:hypothetical protein